MAGASLLGAPGCDHPAKLPEDYLPPSGAAGGNVILVILDSLRKDHIGAYGNPWIKTPNLDALAQEGLRFTRAYPDAMPTIPARRAIHTGTRTFPLEPPAYGWTSIPEDQTTLAERSEEHTSELQSRQYLVCRLLLEKTKGWPGCAAAPAAPGPGPPPAARRRPPPEPRTGRRREPPDDRPLPAVRRTAPGRAPRTRRE